MTCLRENEHGADLLIGYLEGTLPGEVRGQLETHAAECADCRGLLTVQATLGECAAPPVSADFDRGLYARIERERAGRWWRTPWKVAVPAAMAAGLAFTVWTRQASAPGDFDVQQLEQELEVWELLTPIGSAAARN
jgi:hypothetical protein